MKWDNRVLATDTFHRPWYHLPLDLLELLLPSLLPCPDHDLVFAANPAINKYSKCMFENQITSLAVRVRSSLVDSVS